MTTTPEVRQRISDRLAMVKHLIEANDPLAIPGKVGPTVNHKGQHDGGWVHTHAQLDSLVEYSFADVLRHAGSTPRLGHV